MSFIHHIMLKLSSRKSRPTYTFRVLIYIFGIYVKRNYHNRYMYIRIKIKSILYSLKTPDHWYMRYNIII